VINRLVTLAFLAAHVCGLRFELSNDLVRNFVNLDSRLLDKLMTVQWESRGYTHELKMNWKDISTRASPKYSGVDLIVPG